MSVGGPHDGVSAGTARQFVEIENDELAGVHRQGQACAVAIDGQVQGDRGVGLVRAQLSPTLKFVHGDKAAQALGHSHDAGVAVGTGPALVDRFAQLREELSLNGVAAELNPGGLLPMGQEKRSLQILTQQVLPTFK